MLHYLLWSGWWVLNNIETFLHLFNQTNKNSLRLLSLNCHYSNKSLWNCWGLIFVSDRSCDKVTFLIFFKLNKMCLPICNPIVIFRILITLNRVYYTIVNWFCFYKNFKFFNSFINLELLRWQVHFIVILFYIILSHFIQWSAILELNHLYFLDI